ncbi:hypothetical protein HYT25_00350 [Candidatus Pacearchaeota archaeon]|nr:hypothetical protein [Candidatus Pacearchaeota archaeon]
MKNEIKIKKKIIYLALVGLFFLGFLLYIIIDNSVLKENLGPNSLEAKFEMLKTSGTNACGGGESYVSQLSADGTRIRGSCCSTMDFHSYKEQIEGLKKYKKYKIIPEDPYDVSAKWAEEMIEYSKETQLSSGQQDLYNEAMEMSMEGGPCCCKCWHWYAYEGLAKNLIINENFSAEQIAEVWDLSDACGGDHHNHET